MRLEISAPVDTAIVRGRMLDVSGRVSPASAQVRVMGRRAQVVGGTFSAVVPLEQGPNVIDVAATARGRAAALTAFRVTQEERVRVPDLAGVGVDDVKAEIGPLGLKVESESGGGFLDGLLPGEPAVCEQTPAPGTEVRRGTTVRVVVARSC